MAPLGSRPRRDRQLIYSDAYVTMEWMPAIGALYNTWRGFLQNESFRTRMELCVEKLVEHGADRAVGDVRALRPLLESDQDWTNREWAPRATQGGLRYLAVILPQSVFSQLAVQRVVARLGDVSLHTAQFDDAEEGLRWLETVQL